MIEGLFAQLVILRSSPLVLPHHHGLSETISYELSGALLVAHCSGDQVDVLIVDCGFISSHLFEGVDDRASGSLVFPQILFGKHSPFRYVFRWASCMFHFHRGKTTSFFPFSLWPRSQGAAARYWNRNNLRRYCWVRWWVVASISKPSRSPVGTHASTLMLRLPWLKVWSGLAMLARSASAIRKALDPAPL